MVKVGTNANPADLMTKHLRAEVANAHLDMLRFYISAGRAASAPALLACSQSGEDDRWRPRGRADVLERQHRKPRFALFTPMKAARGRKTAAAVGQWRVTVGELADGQEFFRVGNRKATAEPHELMGQPWAGSTYFVESLSAPQLFTPTPI